MFYHVSIQQSIDLEPMYFGPKLRETICLKITDKVGITGVWGGGHTVLLSSPQWHCVLGLWLLACTLEVCVRHLQQQLPIQQLHHLQPARPGTKAGDAVPQVEGTCSPKHGYILAVLKVDEVSKVSTDCTPSIFHAAHGRMWWNARPLLPASACQLCISPQPMCGSLATACFGWGHISLQHRTSRVLRHLCILSERGAAAPGVAVSPCKGAQQSQHTMQSSRLHRLSYCVLQGKIRQDGSGFATFKATFQCITFRPFKHEVLDCVVSQVNKVWSKLRAPAGRVASGISAVGCADTAVSMPA